MNVRVEGLGLGFKSEGFKVKDLRFGVEGLRFRV